MDYRTHIQQKMRTLPPSGFEPSEINPTLFDWQRVVVEWACKRGRAALFEDCGLGKTRQQLAWADQVCKHTGGSVLILAPLAVSDQTCREAEIMGIRCIPCVEQSCISDPGIYITNYEKVHKFALGAFDGIVLDESSILKSKDGKTRTHLISESKKVQYRLACTATPSPNDHTELGQHAEFLGVCTATEMLATYFINDVNGKANAWRLKGHAHESFWQWVASWAVMIRTPADIGFSDDGYVLPEIKFHVHEIETGMVNEGELFTIPAKSMGDVRKARRDTMAHRVSKACSIVNDSSQWIVWTEMNDESTSLSRQIKGASEVAGSTDDDEKSRIMLDFANGKIPVLVTKPKIAGFGMNWQSCHNMVFVGLSYSYEQFYQAVRRCYRFGQKNTVNVHIISTDKDSNVLSAILEKQAKQSQMVDAMVVAARSQTMKNIRGDRGHDSEYPQDEASGDSWKMILGDCVESVSKMEADSIGYSIFSPPFASLYTYSDSAFDMGNCTNHDDFMVQFRFLVRELYRVIKPGRSVSFHCMNLPTSKVRDGHIGIVDFRGMLIREFANVGFIFHSEVCIWKDPVTAMQRTKALGLLHKTIRKDSSMSRQGIPDYLVTMRKPGDNADPIPHGEDLPVDLWQKYASPVWMDINQSDTLQHRSARDDRDEKHICPLQLEVIRRGVHLWSAPGDVVLSPFAGIGSEGYVALKHGRKFIGCELKPSYFAQACANLSAVEKETINQLDMFQVLGIPRPL